MTSAAAPKQTKTKSDFPEERAGFWYRQLGEAVFCLTRPSCYRREVRIPPVTRRPVAGSVPRNNR